MSSKCFRAIVSWVIGLTGLAHLCGHAQGGVLSGLPVIFGPGTPQGVTLGQTISVNNDNAGISNPNRITLSGIDIFGLDPIDILVPVSNSPGTSGTTEYFIELGSATNKTEAAWNGFAIELGSGIGNDFFRLSEMPITGVSGLDFDTPDRNPTVSSPSFLSTVHNADELIFSDGLIPINGVASAQNFSIDVPDILSATNSTYDFTIRLQPQPVSNAEGDYDQDGDVDGEDFLIWQRDPFLASLADWQTNFGRVGGDFDQDGDVDGADFLFWQRAPNQNRLDDWRTNFGKMEGDFDQDGDVDGADFLSWQRAPNQNNLNGWLTNFGNRDFTALRSQAVPEPTTLPLLLIVIVHCVGVRNGRP